MAIAVPVRPVLALQATLLFGVSNINTAGTRYLQPGYLSSGAGTSIRCCSSPIAFSQVVVHICNRAAGAVGSGSPTYTFEFGTIVADAWVSSGLSVAEPPTFRTTSFSGAASGAAGAQVSLRAVVGGTGTIASSPTEIEATLYLIG